MLLAAPLLFAPDSKSLACLDESGGHSPVRRRKPPKPLRPTRRQAWVANGPMVFSKDGKSIFTRNFGELALREWELSTGKELRQFPCRQATAIRRRG